MRNLISRVYLRRFGGFTDEEIFMRTRYVEAEGSRCLRVEVAAFTERETERNASQKVGDGERQQVNLIASALVSI